MAAGKGGSTKLVDVWGEDTIYSECLCAPEDVLYEGSEDDGYESSSIRKRRYEAAGQRFLAGTVPFLLSASMKGPFEGSSGWKNPWLSKRHNASIEQTTDSSLLENGRSAEQRGPRQIHDRQDVAIQLPPAINCHLPSPESLKQAPYTQKHPHLGKDEFEMVCRWREDVKQPPLKKDECWAAVSMNNAPPAKKRSASDSEWLKKTPAKKPKSKSDRKDEHSGRIEEDVDELMADEPSSNFGDTPPFNSPSKRPSPKPAMRRSRGKRICESDDELSPSKAAAAAALSSPVSLRKASVTSTPTKKEQSLNHITSSASTPTTPSRLRHMRVNVVESRNDTTQSEDVFIDQQSSVSIIRARENEQNTAKGACQFERIGALSNGNDGVFAGEQLGRVNDKPGNPTLGIEPKRDISILQQTISKGQSFDGQNIAPVLNSDETRIDSNDENPIAPEQLNKTKRGTRRIMSDDAISTPKEYEKGGSKASEDVETISSQSKLPNLGPLRNPRNECQALAGIADCSKGLSQVESSPPRNRLTPPTTKSSSSSSQIPEHLPVSGDDFSKGTTAAAVREDSANLATEYPEETLPMQYGILNDQGKHNDMAIDMGYNPINSRLDSRSKVAETEPIAFASQQSPWAKTDEMMMPRKPLESVSPNLSKARLLTTLQTELEASSVLVPDVQSPWFRVENCLASSFNSKRVTDEGVTKPSAPQQRPRTPEPQFCFKPFSSFLSPSPKRPRNSQKWSSGAPGSRSSILKTRWSQPRKAGRVSWATPLRQAQGISVTGQGDEEMPASCPRERNRSPPPETSSISDLATGVGNKFSKHFEAMTKGTNGFCAKLLPSASQSTTTSPGHGAMAETFLAAEAGAIAQDQAEDEEERATGEEGLDDGASEEPMDIVEDMFREMGDFWDTWDIDTEMEEARKAGNKDGRHIHHTM
ncbi:uncharacterized protein UV8b_05585 [Ustilaginoidea virens]|uniref:Uncharacterized protein n=1 Tax=Ustilaginoidea virens TaxID=1159556 RepID=A0A063BYJ8_USTVR|nr:uncharacterized protein UV8b_05585 [Ustilaginoidea virens]QUC21342.1 hypothetical protein UV8b_05585 [Ustilaginoidea virens]GAO16200.1 hypothetical protein UVI_02045080 [Ustilaginoidea virens]